MTTEITRLDHPIDVMFLIHKALRAEAAKVEEMVRQFDIGHSLQAFRCAFNFWAATLAYHAQQEDKYMTAPLTNSQPARENEAEHVELGGMLGNLAEFMGEDQTKGIAQRVTEAMLALNKDQHADLVEKLEDVMAVLNEEIGTTKVIARTQRHLYQRVLALRVAQDDHLENEEAFVLPEIWLRISEEDQLKMAQRLLIDEDAEEQRWVMDWVAQALSPKELELLEGLERRFNSVTASVG